ncbi:MAG: GldG family protein [Lachnospiraceae bacterium]|nr:GldG family protein [Lachnospiraceae bacterium]
MEKKNGKGCRSFFKKIGASFQSKGFRSGAYATVISILVIVAVIIVNLIVSALDIRKDLTVDGNKSLTGETEELLSGLEDDLTFYFLMKEGQSLSWLDPSFEMYIDLYQKESKKINFETVDLLLNPKFAEQYTDETVIQYSIIVVNENTKKSKYISSEDMVLTKMTMDTSTFQYKTEVTGLDIEGQINAAIRYVTSGQQTNLYAVTGHGELELGTEGMNLLRKANIEYNTFEIMTADSVPEDCDVLYIAVPSTDYTEAELKVLESYADRGGDFLICAVYQEGMDNFNRLLAKYGVEVENGIVVEGDSKRHHPDSALALFPIVGTSHEITAGLTGSSYLPMPNSYVLTQPDQDNKNLTITTLLSTSEKAFLKSVQNGQIVMTKEEGDPEGPFDIGVYVKNTDTDSEAVILSNGFVFYDNYLMIDSYANAGLLTGSINYMSEVESVSAIRTISFESEEMLAITASEANAIAVMFVIVIPVLLMVAGIVTMVRRRNR